MLGEEGVEKRESYKNRLRQTFSWAFKWLETFLFGISLESEARKCVVFICACFNNANLP